MRKKRQRLKIALLSAGVVALFVLIVFTKLLAIKNNQTHYDTLEDALKNPDKAETLVMRNRKMKTLSPEIGKLHHLKVLNLGNNELKSLPAEIGQLSELEELSVENNSLTILTTEILNLKKLKKLNLSNNNLSLFPILSPNAIEEINLSNNVIIAIPSDIRNMKRLKTIDLAENRIVEIKADVIFPDSIRRIDLFHNGLKTSSPSLFSLLMLRELILEENPLDEVTLERYNKFKNQ